MIDAVNEVRPPRIFPLVIEIAPLPGSKALLMMEHLQSHATLLDTVFQTSISGEHLQRICGKVVSALSTIGRVGEERKRQFRRGQQAGNFADRLDAKFGEVLRIDPYVKPVLRRAGTVMGVRCRAVGQILRKARRFLAKSQHADRFQHGDPHLGNIMVRQYFKRGYGVKLIDPNPGVGFTDPLYDIGKLYHWAEPVGWARVRPDVCHSRWRSNAHSWTLQASHNVPNGSAEKRRKLLLACIEKAVAPLMDSGDVTANQRLDLAIAAAHIGLAARLDGPENTRPRRFVLAHTILHLARWDEMVR